MSSSSPVLAGSPADRIRPAAIAFWALGMVLLGSFIALTVVFMAHALTG